MSDDEMVSKADSERDIAEVKAIKDREIAARDETARKLSERLQDLETRIERIADEPKGEPAGDTASGRQGIKDWLAQDKAERAAEVNTGQLVHYQNAERIAAQFEDFGISMVDLLKLKSESEMIAYALRTGKEQLKGEKDGTPRPPTAPADTGGKGPELDTQEKFVTDYVEGDSNDTKRAKAILDEIHKSGGKLILNGGNR